ncbi:GDP-mannose 4,6-dehydratase [Sporomusa acidovorans]|uniref:GDP-6-deoxy-D-mannose reductase n=1 Tax=Sporomusa acidovorans (strain ATCC 49682 / DSM 3132 / Mol) TaxID=1123286 RepID=A0ABZ3J7X0_SPOA4|nr:GDP-mannose 4,6-dehydratase [Sporomusa acidovorans]OZC19351.1 GDP-6-deoxy-D-mannose reductase [Sporomusa acidovorans DSM 3132]SDD79836.1 Nucleoside-diphosphate-sugar epimerase [Sporomusa acidovorans]
MRVLVTGASGFVGSYLVPALVERGHEVYAGVMDTNYRQFNSAECISFDIIDQHELREAIKSTNPDGIIHLAAQSMVSRSWEKPDLTVKINTIGTINLIGAVKKYASHAKVITVGTSEEYGLTGKKGIPLDETEACLPQNPYAVSKLAAGQLALQLAHKENLNVIHVRPFNHFGPGQARGYVVSDFASQIAKIEQGLCLPSLCVGDLSTQRDFTDVRDVIEAYVNLIENKVENGIYNVCSGTPRRIENILTFLIKAARVPIAVQVDQQRFRPSEVPFFVGSAAKLQKCFGWKPKHNFLDSLTETLNWWRKQDLTVAATEK